MQDYSTSEARSVLADRLCEYFDTRIASGLGEEEYRTGVVELDDDGMYLAVGIRANESDKSPFLVFEIMDNHNSEVKMGDTEIGFAVSVGLSDNDYSGTNMIALRAPVSDFKYLYFELNKLSNIIDKRVYDFVLDMAVLSSQVDCFDAFAEQARDDANHYVHECNVDLRAMMSVCDDVKKKISDSASNIDLDSVDFEPDTLFFIDSDTGGKYTVRYTGSDEHMIISDVTLNFDGSVFADVHSLENHGYINLDQAGNIFGSVGKFSNELCLDKKPAIDLNVLRDPYAGDKDIDMVDKDNFHFDRQL